MLSTQVLAHAGGGFDAEQKISRSGGVRSVSRQPRQAEVWARVRKLALRQLNRLVSLEPKVLRGESPEAVHDLRVASRRLQSLLDFLYPTPRPPQIRKMRRRLKQARGVLGELRNQDVLLARMARVLARQRAARREAWEAGHEYLLKQRPGTAERAHHQLTRLNLAQVYVRLRQELAALAESEEPSLEASPARPGLATQRANATASLEQAPRPAVEVDAAARLAERLAGLWRAFEETSAKARRDLGMLHGFRIATKRLRYLVEVAAAVEFAGSSDALRWLRELQGKLGDWHDLEVLDAMLIEMLARRKFLRANLPLAIGVEKLILNLRGSKARQYRRYLRRALQSAQYRQTAAWVSQSVAPLPPAED